jgi:hypothetical protein
VLLPHACFAERVRLHLAVLIGGQLSGVSPEAIPTEQLVQNKDFRVTTPTP